MRRILVDRAARQSQKRGGKARHFKFEDWLGQQPAKAADMLALAEALSRLSRSEPRPARVVKLRYFGGLTIEQTAAALGVGRETVVRDWQVAKLWLLRELRTGASGRQA